MQRIYLFIMSLVAAMTLLAQAESPQTDDFHVPFEFPLYLSGNFGELRSNHFHGGLDFKTQGVEGKPLHCPANGYISRISVAPGGYGNALYIAHTNGYTTVHGHLQRFLPEVAALVREHQYKYETFAVDTILTPELFQVKRGEVVAWAGNSGYSFGPHLHMEVRLTETNEPVDPLVFYKDKLKDTRPPRAHRIMVYPVKGRGVVDGKTEKRSYVFGQGNRLAQRITAWGEIGVGISANDYMDGTHNSYGVHSVRLLVDGEEVFSSLVDRFSFDENRQINSWTDYEEYHARRRWYMKSFIAPGNPLRMLRARGEGRGIVHVEEERPYRFEYILSDIYGNTSKYAFEVIGVETPVEAVEPSVSLLKWDEHHVMNKEGMLLEIPRGMLYDDVVMDVTTSASSSAYSMVYDFGDEIVPLHSYCPLSIKVSNSIHSFRPNAESDMQIPSLNWEDMDAPYLPFSKLYIVQSRKGWTGSVGGRYENGWIKARIRELGGEFYVAIDTVPPTITPVSSADWNRTGNVRLKISDSQTGISSYRATLDGRWTLMEYSSKNRQLTVRLKDSPIPKNGLLHNLNVIVTDGVGNVTTFEHRIKY